MTARAGLDSHRLRASLKHLLNLPQIESRQTEATIFQRRDFTVNTAAEKPANARHAPACHRDYSSLSNILNMLL
jgi:hypothetical protein